MGLFDKFSKSPVPVEEAVISEESKPITMCFGDAIGEILNKKNITRVEWNNLDEYFLLKDGWLMVHHSGETIFHKLIVSEADLMATDWITING